MLVWLVIKFVGTEVISNLNNVTNLKKVNVTCVNHNISVVWVSISSYRNTYRNTANSIMLDWDSRPYQLLISSRSPIFIDWDNISPTDILSIPEAPAVRSMAVVTVID
jgi:hypothetical protein